MAAPRNRLWKLIQYRSFFLSRQANSSANLKASALRQFSRAADGFDFDNDNEAPRRSPSRRSREENHRPPPLRGQQMSDHSPRSNRPDFRRERTRDDIPDDRFLEKFKLSFNKGDKLNDNASAAQPPTEGEMKPNHNQMAKEQKVPPPEDADEIFKKMKETGLIPNAVAMLDGLCKDGLVQEAMKLFGLMREKGSIPEVVTYTAVVEGFCKAHKFEDAKRIFRKMQANGITPNTFSYTVLVQGLYKCNRVEDALEFCEEMVDAGHSPNVTTFVGLVDGVCREKGVEEAQNVIGRLKQKGFSINEKPVREFLEKKAAFSPTLWEAIFGKKPSQKLF